jgi:uncharacterized protein (TIGR02217 family)
VTGFIDQYLPTKLRGVGFVSAPRFKTSSQVNAGGRERRNREWEHPLMRFVAPEATREWSVTEDLLKHWRITAGPWLSFPLRDPFDFASCDLVKPNLLPTVTMTDQQLGVADGFTDRFQLVKTYSVGSETYDRPIHLPVVASVVIARDGVLVPAADYTVSRPGGEVLFDVPPALGGAGILTAGFLFDCEVRFESDDQLEQIMRATKVAGFSDLTLVEVRPC